jgi:hypothetical protein
MDLKLDRTTNDIYVVDGDLVLVTASEAIVQFVKQKLRTFLGEWFLDLSIGVPYFEEVFKKAPNLTVIDAAIKDQILSTPGIVELLEFTMDAEPATRLLRIEFKARAIEGVINFSEVIP